MWPGQLGNQLHECCTRGSPHATWAWHSDASRSASGATQCTAQFASARYHPYPGSLLGLLGTSTGMISAFGIVSEAGLGQPNAITGGIAEALIATATGLFVAIVTLIPYNYSRSRIEAMTDMMEGRATVGAPSWQARGLTMRIPRQEQPKARIEISP